MGRFDITLFERKLISLWISFKGNHPAFQKLEHEFAALEDSGQQIRMIAERVVDQDPGLADELAKIHPIVQFKGLDLGLANASGDGAGSSGEYSVHLLDSESWILLRVQVPRSPSQHLGQPGVRHLLLHYHRIFRQSISGFHIEIEKVRGYTKRGLERLPAPECKLFLYTFQGAHDPVWDAELRKKNKLSALTVKDPEGVWREIQAALERASALGAALFVLPELTVPPDLRDRIVGWLEKTRHPFLMILPGSFHETDDHGECFNTARLLDARGEEILRHHKLIRFGTEKEGREEIETGRQITLLDTPMGLIAVAICRDFCEENAPFPGLWEELGPDWVLVPSMTGKTGMSAHARAADKLARAWGSRVVVVNAWWGKTLPKDMMDLPCGFVSGGSGRYKSPVTGFFSGELFKK